MQEIKLSRHGKIENQAKYYHNNLDINDWKRNKKVDTINKILIRLVELYLLPSNSKKPINERLTIQNTALSFEKHPETKDVLYSIKTRQVQNILVKLQELGVITEMEYLDKDGSRFKYNALNDKWDDLNGLTKRRIVLNIKKAKELLSLTNNSKGYKNAKPKSTLRRSVMRRPFTLVDMIRDINDNIVSDIRDSKMIVNEYLRLQASKFADFNSKTSALDEVIKDAKKNLYNVLYNVPDNITE